RARGDAEGTSPQNCGFCPVWNCFCCPCCEMYASHLLGRAGLRNELRCSSEDDQSVEGHVC
ncbi:unnamed protein product, partial [Ectocarpus sp. 8 AP-2014]